MGADITYADTQSITTEFWNPKAPDLSPGALELLISGFPDVPGGRREEAAARPKNPKNQKNTKNHKKRTKNEKPEQPKKTEKQQKKQRNT